MAVTEVLTVADLDLEIASGFSLVAFIDLSLASTSTVNLMTQAQLSGELSTVKSLKMLVANLDAAAKGRFLLTGYTAPVLLFFYNGTPINRYNGAPPDKQALYDLTEFYDTPSDFAGHHR